MISSLNCKAKVSNLNLLVLDEDILRLEVSMQNALGMQITTPLYDSPHNLTTLFLFNRLFLFQIIIQSPLLTQLSHDHYHVFAFCLIER